MEFTSKQVIVLGAGAAGLAAARDLVCSGFEPLILEARERIGGRILTVHDPQFPSPVELGAEFVHGRHPALWEVLRDSEVPVAELPGGGDWDEMGRIFDRMKEAPEQSFAEFIATVDAPEYLKRAATGFVEGFNAAHKERVSVEWLNREKAASDEIEGDRSFRVRSGYDSVPRFLSQGLDIRLGTPVRRIRWKRGEVIAETDSGEVRSAKAIVTVPMAVLFANALTIDPEPPVLTQARRAIGTGQAIRVTFGFREAIRQTGFLHADEPFPVCWTDGPLVTAWAGGSKADALGAHSPEALKRIALASLRGILGEDPGEPVGAWFHDWRTDPWSRAAYSYVCVGGMKVQQSLSDPVEDTLYFAGEAVAPSGHIGTVHGAIVSGRKAASPIIA